MANRFTRFFGFAPAPPAPSKAQALTMFDAGKSGRRLRTVPTSTDMINRQIRVYGRTVLARSRYLCANNPWAAAAKESYVNALVGSGIIPSPLLDSAEQKKEIKIVWRDWSDQSDADGLTDFYGQQYIVAGEMFEAGECFIRMRTRRIEDGIKVPMQLQILPAEMLDLQYNISATNGTNRIECGIEFDAIGRRVAYHFWRQHPGNDIYSVTNTQLRTRVPADEILHLFKPMGAGQIRGLPHTISAITKLAILDSYEDAELERKRSTALFSGFIERPAEIDEEHPLENVLDASASIPGMAGAVGLEPGAMVDLAPGETVKFAEPADVGATYEPFLYRNLLGVAAGFGVPYMNMTGDLRQTSYGSMRGGDIAFRRRISAVQNHVMIFQMCRPIWERWMTDAVMVGAIQRIDRSSFLSAPQNFTRVRWIPPKWEWIDPLKDRQAEKIAIEQGWKSRDDLIEEEGYDPEENDERIKASQDRAEKLNLVLVSDPQILLDPNDAADAGADPNADPAPADAPKKKKAAAPAPKPARAEAEPARVTDDRIVDAALDAMAELAKPREPPNITVNIPKMQRTRTRVVAHDENGRISETVTEPINENE